MRRALRRPSGNVAVEFALLLPILLFVTLGAIDYGYFFYTQEVIANAAREGARVGSVASGNYLGAAQDAATAYLTGTGLATGPRPCTADATDAPGPAVHVVVTCAAGSITGFMSARPFGASAALFPESQGAIAEMRR